MKIDNRIKGIHYGSDDEFEGFSDNLSEDEYAYILEQEERWKRNDVAEQKWEEQGEENLKTLIAKQKPLVEQFKKDQAKAKIYGKEIVYIGESFIGERIVFLLEKNNQEIAEFCRNIGMSRSSLHRYIKGSFLPSEKSLRRIIEGLFVSVADFCYEPNDFEKWKSAFGKANEVNDIFKFREELLSKLRLNNFTYQANGITRRLPNRYFELVRNTLKSSLGILDLLPHDNQE